MQGDLTTLDTALAWLGMDTDDGADTIARLISAISAQIQQFISRNIASTTYTRSFNGRGMRMLMLPDYPLSAVASVTVDGQSIPARVGRTPGFVFSDNAVMLDAPYCFTRGFQNVQVAYTAGYASTPPDIEQACLMWLKVAVEAQDRAANVNLQRAGDTEIRYDGDTTRMDRGLIPMPPSIFAILQPYSRVFPA